MLHDLSTVIGNCIVILVLMDCCFRLLFVVSSWMFVSSCMFFLRFSMNGSLSCTYFRIHFLDDGEAVDT